MGKGLIKSEIGAGLYSVELDIEGSANITQNVWCADYTENITGTVGIIEIAGEKEKGVNIQPGWQGNCAYSENRDGQLAACGTTKDEAWETFWNWSMRPGWQKWKPNYRYGTITSINGDSGLCSVNLDACVSTDSPENKVLDINQSSSLSGVEISYMSCGSRVFTVGDSVIVEFQDYEWSAPVIIGFKDNPKNCGYAVEINITSVEGSEEFKTLAAERIAEINEYKAYLTYYHDVYVPRVLAFLDSLVGKCKFSASGVQTEI